MTTDTNDRFEGYSFDCMIKKEDGKELFVECHGEYWHGPERESRDRAKATFLHRYRSDAELLVLWEHEFRSVNRLKDILKQKLGLKRFSLRPFSFKDVLITQSPITDDLKSLFARHHYLANIGRFGSLRYIGTIGDDLAIAVIFSSLTRQQSAVKFGLKSKQMLELTRFCIHPCYQKKNFASWFLSRTLKRLNKDKPKIKRVITFADQTYGHEGTIYKASGWKVEHRVKPDYWYVDSYGGWYHKKPYGTMHLRWA